MLHQPAFVRVSLGGGSFSFNVAGLPPWPETQLQVNCLFESHSCQQVYYQYRVLFKLVEIY